MNKIMVQDHTVLKLICPLILVLIFEVYALLYSILLNAYSDFSTSSTASMTPFHFAHSASPPGIPPTSGNLVPSVSPKPLSLLIASLIPTVPNLTTSSSIELTLNCSSLRSWISASVGWVLDDSSKSRTSDLGKNPAEPSMAPAKPTEITGRSC